MKIMKRITWFLFVFIAFMSCGKFEEGPMISFRSVKNRVSGEWTLDKYISNGVDSTEFYLNGGTEDYKFTSDFTVEYTEVGKDMVTGTWEIQDNLVLLKLEMESPQGLNYIEQDTLNLIRLTNQEMWAVYGNDVVKQFTAK
jgi:hypothetical protein